MKKIALLLAITFAIMLVMSHSTLACPGCSAAMGPSAGTASETNWGRSFSISIYFMLVTVNGLIGFLGYKVYKIIKAEEKRHAVPTVATR